MEKIQQRLIKNKKVSRKLQLVFVIMLSVIMVAIFVFPFLYLGFSTLKTSQDVISTTPTLLPREISFENWVRMFDRLPVDKYIFNSLIISLSATFLAVFLGSLSSYAIARSGSRISSALLIIVLCLKMIPLSSIAVPVYTIVAKLGIYDTRVAMIMVLSAVNMPFVMWVMSGYYGTISTSLDEAACVDGASSLRTFTSIILPVSLPGIMTSAIFVMFMCWNDFIFGLLLTSTTAKTFSVAISEFLTAYGLDFGPMTSAAFMFSFPVLIISMFIQKYIVKGFTAGAIKE